MPDSRIVDVFEACSQNWQRAISQNDFHEAIVVAIGGYLYYREKRDEQIASGCLNLIYVAIGHLLQVDMPAVSTESCSFCGRSGVEVQLGAGPEAYICSDCVEIFHDTFRSKTAD